MITGRIKLWIQTKNSKPKNLLARYVHTHTHTHTDIEGTGPMTTLKDSVLISNDSIIITPTGFVR